MLLAAVILHLACGALAKASSQAIFESRKDVAPPTWRHWQLSADSSPTQFMQLNRIAAIFNEYDLKRSIQVSASMMPSGNSSMTLVTSFTTPIPPISSPQTPSSTAASTDTPTPSRIVPVIQFSSTLPTFSHSNTSIPSSSMPMVPFFPCSTVLAQFPCTTPLTSSSSINM